MSSIIYFIIGLLIGSLTRNHLLVEATTLYIKSMKRKSDYVYKKILEAGVLRKENEALKEQIKKRNR